jgi:hypothetical protein
VTPTDYVEHLFKGTGAGNKSMTMNLYSALSARFANSLYFLCVQKIPRVKRATKYYISLALKVDSLFDLLI